MSFPPYLHEAFQRYIQSFTFLSVLSSNQVLNMGNSSSPLGKRNPLPIETAFKFPSPLSSWPQGEGFAGGSIDLGWFEVKQVSTFTKVWTTLEGGPDNLGASFFEPSSIPDGFFMLGSYSQPNNEPFFGWVLVGKDTNPNDDAVPVLKTPVDYKLVWSSENTKIKQESNGYIWEPIPAEGYKAVGYIVTTTAEKPSLEKIRTVRSDLTDSCEHETLIWGSTGAKNMINVYSLRPTNRGTQSLSVPVGTFIAEVDGSTSSAISCLKSIRGSNSYYMPNIAQIEALFQAYSPLIYLHPDEHYQISSVNWYFSNGTLLYEQGKETSVPIEPNGSNLPQGDSNDGKYWIDLPVDKGSKEKVKKGDLQSSEAYLHVKPMLGGTFTDISTWVFYPFNGPAKAKVEFINIGLGRIGEHIGDWEHLTLRISNFTGELRRVYFSEHSKGIWLNASQVEYVENSNKAVAYASLNGHAFYPKEGLVLQGKNGVGIRNETEKSKLTMDTGERFSVVSAEYLETGTVVEPLWLNYTREWGPKIDYSIDDELRKVERFLPGKLKTAFKKFVDGLPDEILGEQGPTGPKMKNNWNGDEPV